MLGSINPRGIFMARRNEELGGYLIGKGFSYSVNPFDDQEEVYSLGDLRIDVLDGRIYLTVPGEPSIETSPREIRSMI